MRSQNYGAYGPGGRDNTAPWGDHKYAQTPSSQGRAGGARIPQGGILEPLGGGSHVPIREIYKMLAKKLPTGQDPNDKKAREQIFRNMDVNGNSYLSLAEVDKGVRDVLGIDELFDSKAVIMRAFQASKDVASNKLGPSAVGKDYIERVEFRLLLVYLRQYFEFKEMFDKIDTNNDNRVDYNEFLTGVKHLKAWGARIGEPIKVFNQMDNNRGGKILFDEFADWAAKCKLDLEDDGDDCVHPNPKKNFSSSPSNQTNQTTNNSRYGPAPTNQNSSIPSNRSPNPPNNPSTNPNNNSSPSRNNYDSPSTLNAPPTNNIFGRNEARRSPNQKKRSPKTAPAE